MGIEPAKNDMKGLTTAEEEAQDLYACVLCEGCGPTQVDSEGRCIHHDGDDCKTLVNSWGNWWNGTIEP